MADIPDASSYRVYQFQIRRKLISKNRPPFNIIQDPVEAVEMMRNLITHQDREHFFVLHLDAGNQVIGIDLAAIGDASSVPVHPATIYRAAILSGAVGIVIAHNHLSERTAPSIDDDAITKVIYEVGSLLRLPLLDHIIFTTTHHFSYAVEHRGPYEKD